MNSSQQAIAVLLHAAFQLGVECLGHFWHHHGVGRPWSIDDVEEDLEHTLDRIFVIVNQYNPTTKIARAAYEALKEPYTEYLLPIAIRQCTKFAQASSEGLPIFAFDPESKGAEDIQALIDMTDVSAMPATEELHA